MREYCLPNNFSLCPQCKLRCEVRLTQKSQYIVFLNMKKQEKLQVLEFKYENDKHLKYELKAEVFYKGMDKNRHYISKRKILNPCRG